jgi:choline-sulfatase
MNILFLMSDEHRADVAGFAGNDVVRTPFLDWLAETGVVFDNAYTPSPICMPARQAMASGQYCHTCDCRRYGEDLPPFSMTFARQFSRHGYQTTACGKLHHLGADQMQGWSRRVGMDHMLAPAAIDEKCAASWARIASKGPSDPSPDHWRGGNKWTDSKEIRRAGVGRGPNTHVWDEYAEAGAKAVIDEHFQDLYYDKNSPHQPLLLYLGFSNPHYPYLADEERFAYYLNRVRPFVDEQPFDHPWLGRSAFEEGPVTVGPGGQVSERDVRRATAAYYANIEKIDAQYQSVADHLRLAGQDLDDWIIVYCSDHGEMLGEHAVWEKQKFFEGSVRVPLIIRWPKGFQGGRRIAQNVNLVDLFATLCDLSGLPLPEGRDSRSLVPLLRDGDAPWENETLSHFGDDFLMIKRDALKYQSYGPDLPEVLFDLDRDPSERENFIHLPEYASALSAFRARRDAVGYGPDAGS